MIGATLLVVDPRGTVLCGHFNDRAVRTSPTLDTPYVDAFRPGETHDPVSIPFRSSLREIRGREESDYDHW